MAVFRIEKTRDYTVMSNYHLRDRSLSLKAKGLLSLMLSLPEDWDYTMKGLARICKDGIDSISGGIRELETHGYLVRARVRNENGQLGSIEYTILERPKEPAQTPAPIREKPIRENPIQVNPMLDAPIQENPAQLNTKEQNKELSITQGSSPIPSSPPTPREKSRIGQDRMRERESYREIILENIDYDILTQDEKLDRDRLDELVELMVDTVCSNREMIRIAGDDYPAEVVKSRFLKIDSSHIEYVLERMRENTTYVRNIKKYLLAALYNAPVTMDSYYTSLVSHEPVRQRRSEVNALQEEITQKTLALCVETGKMTAQLLQQAMKKVLADMEKHKNDPQLRHGKQTIWQLMKHGAGVSNIEITDQNIKAFSATAKKYGLDFALKKDISGEHTRYLVFFKGRDADVITAAFRELSAKNLAKEKSPPSAGG